MSSAEELRIVRAARGLWEGQRLATRSVDEGGASLSPQNEWARNHSAQRTGAELFKGETLSSRCYVVYK